MLSGHYEIMGATHAVRNRVKPMEFLLNPDRIPLQKYQMSQRFLLRLIKSMFENKKCGINCRRACSLLFKYYIRNLEGVADMEKGADAWTLSAEIIENCGNF